MALKNAEELALWILMILFTTLKERKQEAYFSTVLFPEQKMRPWIWLALLVSYHRPLDACKSHVQLRILFFSVYSTCIPLSQHIERQWIVRVLGIIFHFNCWKSIHFASIFLLCNPTLAQVGSMSSISWRAGNATSSFVSRLPSLRTKEQKSTRCCHDQLPLHPPPALQWHIDVSFFSAAHQSWSELCVSSSSHPS